MLLGVFIFYYVFAFLSPYHEKVTEHYTSLKRNCRLLCTTLSLRWEILLSVFPKDTTSKLAGLLHTVPLMLNVKQRSCEYQFSSQWFDLTDQEADALSTKPSDRLNRGLFIVMIFPDSKLLLCSTGLAKV